MAQLPDTYTKVTRYLVHDDGPAWSGQIASRRGASIPRLRPVNPCHRKPGPRPGIAWLELLSSNTGPASMVFGGLDHTEAANQRLGGAFRLRFIPLSTRA